jgi:hypothetical protein
VSKRKEPTNDLNELGLLNICLKLEIGLAMSQRKEGPTMGPLQKKKKKEAFLGIYYVSRNRY